MSFFKIYELKKFVNLFIKIDTAAILADLFIMGAGMVGIAPFACEALVELAFPAEENVNINIFYWLACLLSLGGVYLSTWSIFGSNGAYTLLIVLAPFCVYIVLWYKPIFRRTNIEVRKSKFSSSFNDGINIEHNKILDNNE